MKTLLQALAILGLAAALSVASFIFRPEAGRWGASENEIELSAAQALGEALWVDARVEEAYQASHFEGAVLANEEDWESGLVRVLDRWAPGTPIVVYCSSQSCLRSHQVADRLRAELGAEQVFALTGGWEALVEAGLAKEGEE